MAIDFKPLDELFAPAYQLGYISTTGDIEVGPNTYNVFHTYTIVERQQIFQVCEKHLPWEDTEEQEQWERTMYMYQFIIKSPPPFPYLEYQLSEEIVVTEFLIYKGPHWMDKLTSEQVQALSVIKKNHYEHRYQSGDYIECQEAGMWPDVAAKAGKFYYLRVPGKKKDLNYLTKSCFRDYNLEEETYYSREADKEIVEIQKTKVIDVVSAKLSLMQQYLEYKPIVYKRRYQLDMTNLTAEEMKSFTDGEFLALSEVRFAELIKDKLG